LTQIYTFEPENDLKAFKLLERWFGQRRSQSLILEAEVKGFNEGSVFSDRRGDDYFSY